MKFVNAEYNGALCEIYFFKSWSTYEHPVTPKDPIEYEEALSRRGFCRAWICDSAKGKLFVRFESVKNDIEITKITKRNNNDNIYFYEIKDNNVGRNLSDKEILSLDRFLIEFPGKDKYFFKVQQKKSIFEYIYDNNGVLKEAIITSIDGRVNKLSY